MVVEQLTMHGTKGILPPGIDELMTDKENVLPGEDTTEYGSLAARLNYVSADRPDIKFAVKELCRCMSAPTNNSQETLRSVAKYFVDTPGLVWKFNWQREGEHIQVWCGANWAGCKATRKSTSGGAIQLGQHTLRTHSKTQSNIALSSAGSELYAMAKAAAEGLGMLTLIHESGTQTSLVMHVEARQPWA